MFSIIGITLLFMCSESKEIYYMKKQANSTYYSVLENVVSSLSCAKACTTESDRCVAFHYSPTRVCQLLDWVQLNVGTEEVWVPEETEGTAVPQLSKLFMNVKF